MSRKIEDLTPEMQEIVRNWLRLIEAEGIDILITCTRRTLKEQEELYAIGRTRPGKKVTWTLKSRHLEGKAIDFVVLTNGKPDWNMNFKEQWLKVIDIGKKLGLRQVVNSKGKIMEYAHLELGEKVNYGMV